jgi:hypothetical protein
MFFWGIEIMSGQTLASRIPRRHVSNGTDEISGHDHNVVSVGGLEMLGFLEP